MYIVILGGEPYTTHAMIPIHLHRHPFICQMLLQRRQVLESKRLSIRVVNGIGTDGDMIGIHGVIDIHGPIPTCFSIASHYYCTVHVVR